MDEIEQNIKNKISTLPKGQLISFDDLIDYGSFHTVKKVLNKLEKEGSIIKVIKGIFEVPKYSKLTNEKVPPCIEDIAAFLAHKNHWTIVHSGLWCLNFLGLSTQLPGTFEYISDGPNRTYNVHGTSLKFKHTVEKDIKNMSVRSRQVVQAIKTIGKDNICEKDIIKLKNNLPVQDKEKLKNECKRVTKWVYRYIEKIVE